MMLWLSLLLTLAGMTKRVCLSTKVAMTLLLEPAIRSPSALSALPAMMPRYRSILGFCGSLADKNRIIELAQGVGS